MTAKILPFTTRGGAIEKGFGGFNKGTHIPIELEADEITTITVKAGDDLVTLSFIPIRMDGTGTKFECVDIAMDNRQQHKTLLISGNHRVRQDAGITVLLLNDEHYKNS